MSKNLEAKQITIGGLFNENKFIIPIYQRNYSWTEDECEKLWEDLYDFFFPNDNADDFDTESSFYLGSIVAFENQDGEKRKEVIDGQQRLTTLTLLLRALLDEFKDKQEKEYIGLQGKIKKCIWCEDDYGNIDETQKETLRVKSEVANDTEKGILINILLGEIAGVDDKSKSNYLKNFNWFKDKIKKLKDNSNSNKIDLIPIRLLNNCIVIYIEATKQEDALRIFSTLNDRGLPLADTDIFKSELYKSTPENNRKEFIANWQEIELVASEVVKNSKLNNPMDEIFTYYMYYLRGKEKTTSSTTIGLRKFYEGKDYFTDKRIETMNDIRFLAEFWKDVVSRNEERFDENVINRFFVLKDVPNAMWKNLVSVYILQNRDLEQEKLIDFLDKTIAFFLASIVNHISNSNMKSPIFNVMKNIIENKELKWEKYDENQIKDNIKNFEFKNASNITKSILRWWSIIHKEEKLDLSKNYDIEHIYARNLYNDMKTIRGKFKDERNIESLGNKILLEKKVNVAASDKWFEFKKEKYKESKIKEVNTELVKKEKFEEQEIIERNKEIIEAFIGFIRKNGLL